MDRSAKTMGMEEVFIALRSSWQNAYAERFIALNASRPANITFASSYFILVYFS